MSSKRQTNRSAAQLSSTWPILPAMLLGTGCGGAGSAEPLVESQQAATGAQALPFPSQTFPLQIVNRRSGKCLDTAGGGLGDGVNAQQFDCIGVKNEEWWVVPVGNNLYQIRTGHIGRCLNRANGSSANNTNVQQFSCAGAPSAEHWEFVFAGTPGNASIYEIRAPGTTQCLDIAGGSLDNGGNAQMFQCIGVDNERWWLRPRLDANNVLMAKHSNLCLAIAGGSQSNNAAAVQASCSNTALHERWVVEPAPGTGAATDGTFFIKAKHSGKCLDVPNASTADNVALQQFDCIGVANERWSFRPDDATDYYEIQNSNSGKCLQVSNGSTADGSAVVQTTCGSASSQRWRVGYYTNRHIRQLRVARADGTGRKSLSETVVKQMASRVNSVYQWVGVHVSYSVAAGDAVDINDDAVFNLATGGNFVCAKNGLVMAAVDCANLYAADFPNDIVIIPSAGFSDVGFKFLGQVFPNNGPGTCQFNDINMAHELGHYLGLQHPFAAAGTEANLSAALQAAGDNQFLAFDGDGLFDTAPEPLKSPPEWTCSTTASTTTLSLQGAAGPVNVVVPLQNIMGYYYNRTKSISANQGAIVRALMGIRGM